MPLLKTLKSFVPSTASNPILIGTLLGNLISYGIRLYQEKYQEKYQYKTAKDGEIQLFPSLLETDALIKQAFADMGQSEPNIFYDLRIPKIVITENRPTQIEDDTCYIIKKSKKLNASNDVYYWRIFVNRSQMPNTKFYITFQDKNGIYEQNFTASVEEDLKRIVLELFNLKSKMQPLSVSSSFFSKQATVVVDALTTLYSPVQLYARAGHEAVHHQYRHNLVGPFATGFLMFGLLDMLNRFEINSPLSSIMTVFIAHVLSIHTIDRFAEIQADIESVKKLNTASEMIKCHNSLMQFDSNQSKIGRFFDPHPSLQKRNDYLKAYETDAKPRLYQSSLWQQIKTKQDGREDCTIEATTEKSSLLKQS